MLTWMAPVIQLMGAMLHDASLAADCLLVCCTQSLVLTILACGCAAATLEAPLLVTHVKDYIRCFAAACLAWNAAAPDTYRISYHP